MEVCWNNSNSKFHFTAIYGSPQHQYRKFLWEDLEQIASNLSSPWLLAGDFNAITNQNDRRGGASRRAHGCPLFNSFIHSNGLIDMGFNGPRFTWRRGSLFMRLDRAICSPSWIQSFPGSSLDHLPKLHSDHRPIHIKLGLNFHGQSFEPPFRFLAPWLTHSDFQNIVHRIWNSGSELLPCIEAFRNEMKIWNVETFGHIGRRKRKLFRRLNGLQSKLEAPSVLPSDFLVDLEVSLREELEEAHGIKVVLDQPMVGRGMVDNPMNALIVPSPLPVELSPAQIVGITKFGGYIEAASGLGLGIPSAQALQRNHETSYNQTGNPSKHFPLANVSMWTKTFGSLASVNLKGGIIVEKVKGPLSKGHLVLHTTDPNDNPLVTFNYFKEPEDLRICVEGMKTITDVINSKAFSKFRYKNVPVQALIDLVLSLPVNLRPKHASAAFSLEQFCIDTVTTIWHYHGGCQVGKVVDHDYKVMGVDSLRVIDGSTFFSSLGTNPQATVMMLGRYMGQKILRERK
ncbi:hypothetical protein K1719_044331 [Acacia pycnantha]|nr:hypothetical protein K1719_044331 [Acacia pycnantha]